MATGIETDFFSSLRYGNLVEAHPIPDGAASRAETDFLAVDPLGVPVLEEKVATFGSAVLPAVDSGEDFFVLVIGCPPQARVVHVRGLRSDALQPVDQNWSL